MPQLTMQCPVACGCLLQAHNKAPALAAVQGGADSMGAGARRWAAGQGLCPAVLHPAARQVWVVAAGTKLALMRRVRDAAWWRVGGAHVLGEVSGHCQHKTHSSRWGDRQRGKGEWSSESKPPWGLYTEGAAGGHGCCTGCAGEPSRVGRNGGSKEMVGWRLEGVEVYSLAMD